MNLMVAVVVEVRTDGRCEDDEAGPVVFDETAHLEVDDTSGVCRGKCSALPSCESAVVNSSMRRLNEASGSLGFDISRVSR